MNSSVFRLRIPHRVKQALKSLHPHLKKKIRAGLELLISDFNLGKPLRDELEGLQSFRVGKFRIVYRTGAGKIIDIIAIGPRKTIYAETYRLISRTKSS